MVTVVKSLDPNSESKCETEAPLSLSAHAASNSLQHSDVTITAEPESQAIGDVDNKINEESRTTHLHNILLQKTAEETLLHFPDLFSKGALVPQSRVWCRENSGQV